MGNQSLLASNYASHPYFRFNTPPMAISAKEVSDFIVPFSRMRSLSRELSASQIQTSTDLAIAALRTIAESLKRQSANEYETLFLDELFSHCEKLVGEQGGHEQERRTVELGTSHPGAVDYAGMLAADQHFFDRLPAAVVAEISDVVKDSLASLRQAAAQGLTRREDLSVNSGPVIEATRKILNRSFGSSGILSALGSYAGTTVEVTGVALELSVPQAGWWANGFPKLDRAPSTLYAHVDESVHHPKAIVYLTNVGPENGPTSCYPHAYEVLGINPLQDLVGRVVAKVGNTPASPLYDYYQRKYHQAMTSERFRAHYMRLPDALRFNSHFGWDVMPGSDVERAMEETQKTLLGPAGTFIVFDGGRLVHRGGLIQSGERVVLQVIMSSMDLKKKVLGKIRSLIR